MSQPFERKGCKRKKFYKDKIAAMIGQASVLNRTGNQTRYYKCKFCPGWHLTSKAYMEFD